MNRFEAYAKRLIWPAAFLLATFVAGCGGGSGGGAVVAPGTPVSGSVVKGPVSGATVNFFALNNDGSKGAQINVPATTDAAGIFSTILTQAPTAPVLAEASGGSYVDEATGAIVTLAATDVLSAVLPAGATSAAITPLTHIAATRARELARIANTAAALSAAIASSNTSVAQQYGVDNILTTVPVAANTSASAAASVTAAQRQYGLVLAGIAQEAAILGVRTIDLISALAKDVKDGTLNGTDSSSGTAVAVTMPLIAGGTAILPTTAGIAGIQAGITAFIASPNNKSGMTALTIPTTPVQVGDTTPPTVTASTPANNATGVALNTAVNVTFSKAMNSASLTSTSFTLSAGGTAVSGTVAYSGNNATFTPSAALAVSTLYTATVTTAATDLAGNALASNFVWTFTTGAIADTTPPTVNSTVPADVATGVALNANVTATFSKAMNPATITTATFTLAQGTTAVAGAVTYAGTTATFTPTAKLAAGLLYTATITTGVKDLAGNAMVANKTWSFTAAKGPAPVNLGTAGNFVILSKSGITDVPTSAVVGDVGSSPITGAAILVTCTEVTGKVYSVDAAGPAPCVLTDATRLTTAIGDMAIAYTDAAGRTLPDFTELGAGDISGKTLVAGLYKWSTSVSINTDVTLTGGPNDVWIFQIAGNLTLAPAKKVILSGGALAKNIFWQLVGDGVVDATLGTTSHFEGIILSQNAIHLNTGASINGRLLAQKAVTLQSNAVTQPAP